MRIISNNNMLEPINSNIALKLCTLFMYYENEVYYYKQRMTTGLLLLNKS